jgi:hypothetical protein
LLTLRRRILGWTASEAALMGVLVAEVAGVLMGV